MQTWPRKRAKRATARVRSWKPVSEGLLGFVGYKAGMTRVMATSAHKTSMTKGEEVAVPVTIIECPPLKIYSVRAYTKKGGLRVHKEVVVGKEKHLRRRIMTKKAHDPQALDKILNDDVSDITILAFTQPSLTGFGKKKPEIIELHMGGSNEEKLKFVKEHLASGIKASEVFKEGDYLDIHGVTKGKGVQGPVKRFGIGLKPHKSEKGRRGPGAKGSWIAQQHWQYRTPHAGQTGYHLRTQYNTQILKISDDLEAVNPKGGLLRFGLVKNEYLLVKGSAHGSKKRALTLVKAQRLHESRTPPTIESISTRSQQRR